MENQLDQLERIERIYLKLKKFIGVAKSTPQNKSVAHHGTFPFNGTMRKWRWDAERREGFREPSFHEFLAMHGRIQG